MIIDKCVVIKEYLMKNDKDDLIRIEAVKSKLLIGFIKEVFMRVI